MDRPGSPMGMDGPKVRFPQTSLPESMFIFALNKGAILPKQSATLLDVALDYRVPHVFTTSERSACESQ